MSFELKSGVNFPPDDIELDKILLGFSEYFINGEYIERDILTFLKEGSGLYSQENECIGADDSNFGSHRKDRVEIIRKYIQTISFLWRNKDDSIIKRHIESTFEDIYSIDISKEIEIGRNQELVNLSRATKEVVFDLVDARSLLRNSEIVEFETAEEIFGFMCQILGLERVVAYLKGEGERTLEFKLSKNEEFGFSRLNHINTECFEGVLTNYLISIGKYSEWMFPDSGLMYTQSGLRWPDLEKIQLKQKQS